MLIPFSLRANLCLDVLPLQSLSYLKFLLNFHDSCHEPSIPLNLSEVPSGKKESLCPLWGQLWLSGNRIRLPMQEMWVLSLGQENPLEKKMATHSSILAWKIPWNLVSPQGCRVRDDWARTYAHTPLCFSNLVHTLLTQLDSVHTCVSLPCRTCPFVPKSLNNVWWINDHHKENMRYNQPNKLASNSHIWQFYDCIITSRHPEKRFRNTTKATKYIFLSKKGKQNIMMFFIIEKQ